MDVEPFESMTGEEGRRKVLQIAVSIVVRLIDLPLLTWPQKPSEAIPILWGADVKLRTADGEKRPRLFLDVPLGSLTCSISSDLFVRYPRQSLMNVVIVV
jgi:hypothetical protein